MYDIFIKLYELVHVYCFLIGMMPPHPTLPSTHARAPALMSTPGRGRVVAAIHAKQLARVRPHAGEEDIPAEAVQCDEKAAPSACATRTVRAHGVVIPPKSKKPQNKNIHNFLVLH